MRKRHGVGFGPGLTLVVAEHTRAVCSPQSWGGPIHHSDFSQMRSANEASVASADPMLGDD